jgi:hypothetical protein
MTYSRSISKSHLLLALAILALCCAPAFGGTVTINNSDSGWYDQTGFNSAGNANYSAGNHFDSQLNDYFSFTLTGVSGTVTAATFNVSSYSVFVSGTYDIYSTSLTPAQMGGGCSGCVAIFNALSSGSLIGSLGVTPSDSNTTLTIALNAAGLAWLTANEGGGIVLGGAFPQPANGGDNDIFGNSSFTDSNNLTITSGSVPEPSSVVFMGTGLLLLLGGARGLRNRRG